MSTMKAQALPTAGRDLLLELHRNKDRLPPYNTKLVRACFQDLQDSVQELQHQVRAASSSVAGSGGGEQQQPQYQQEEEGGGKKPSMSTRPSILHQNERIQRQKRYLLAYHRHRMELLKEQQHPGAGGTSTGGGGGAANAQEVEFQNDYRELRALYAEQVFELDAVPPTSHMVQVRVLRDMQQVVLESGRAVTFTKGSWLYLPRADVLEFLRDGTLELKEGEEVDF